MTAHVMRNHGSLFDNNLIGLYLVSFDPDGHGGLGQAEWTADVAKARRFDSAMDVIVCWRQQSTVVPLRDDGKPNRPLTAYTIEPVPLDDDGSPVHPL